MTKVRIAIDPRPSVEFFMHAVVMRGIVARRKRCRYERGS